LWPRPAAAAPPGARPGATAGAPAVGSTNADISALSPQAQLGGDGSYARVWQDGLRICTTNEQPFNVPDASGKWSGIDADIANEAVARLGIPKVSYVEGPWDSMVPNLQSNRCDLLQTNIHQTDPRLLVIDFTAPIYFYGDALAVQKGNPKNIHTYEDLKGKTVGTLLGSEYVEWLDKRTDLGAVKTYQDQPGMFTDLMNGRLDAVIFVDLSTEVFMKMHAEAQNGMELATGYVPQADQKDYIRFGVQLGAHDLANAFSRVVDEMRIDGTLAAILAKYGVAARAFQTYTAPK
jgi:ABC-type amino acid transport substrate-binding protein